ncbi:alpha-amylase family glycosyl hydrolase [Vibrio tapetis]|uniref:Glycosidase n=1 Tax=Vibrio tapetis subsp. tapetis TaxID=1671868 RepID=A0A2N8ZKM6_9VIBR|nr:Glycosidase [Vibrio tapetis subsp. tapetis]
MNSRNWNKGNTLIISAILSGVLVGCGSSGSSSSELQPVVDDKPVVTPYACLDSTEQAVNDLRIYQVMVESFVSGDDTIGHGTGYGTSQHNGDIQGIIDSLDYVESLGMNAIWLTPIFNSVAIDGQNHWADRLDATGYFATDYFAIDPRFGTMEKAKELVEKAHAKGLYVFFDGVFGHHKENVVASPTGKRPVGKSNPVSYPESLAFYQEVAEYWVTELKIDGWRLDQAYQVPTDAWSQIRKTVDQASASVTYQNKEGKTVNPLGYMVAEIWNNESYIKQTGYGETNAPALCSAFDFPVRYRVVETFAVNESGVGGKGGDWLNEGMSLHQTYPDHAKPNLMIGNHDLVRFGDLIQRGELGQPTEAKYWQRYRAALSFQAAYTGPITMYYGDEIGDQLDGYANKVETDCAVQGLCEDHVARTDGKVAGVNATLNRDQAALKNYVTSLMKLRAEHPALYSGKRVNVIASKQAYVDHKQFGTDTVLYVVSTSDQAQTLTITGEQIGSAGKLVDLQSRDELALASGHYTITLAPFEARFLKVDTPNSVGPIASSTSNGAIDGDAFMAKCDNPLSDEAGPVSNALYVVGDFSDSNWKHVEGRKLTHRGNGVYQMTFTEKPGSYKMQYATKGWRSQYTAEGMGLKLGKETALMNGGYGKDTVASLIDGGEYVWSLKFDDSGNPTSVMVAQCQ